ncbi:hypothetical protein HMPREF0294_0049 [Corynebacterium glucuronolyticum ATCC 51867]|nr:hypothetical protein HMPREF0294_0049 [Corynebacterium glucuronolyticum ATCC 51867]
MTMVSSKKNFDPSRVNEISEKLMENPQLASLIGELSTSTDDASELPAWLAAGLSQRRAASRNRCPFRLRVL